MNEQARDGNEAAADWIGREPETFERVRAEKRRGLGLGEDKKGDYGTVAHADPALADVVLDARPSAGRRTCSCAQRKRRDETDDEHRVGERDQRSLAAGQ